MITQQTLMTLRRLKLNGMADAFEQQLTQPIHSEKIVLPIWSASFRKRTWTRDT